MAQYTESDELFINPYNFVPINLKKTKRSDITQPQDQQLTGYLACRIRCRTPLAIPDVERDVERKEELPNGHKKYPFFTIDGNTPVIPGSTIRGVIRSVYETLTDSCFGTLKSDMLITARSEKPFQPGLLIRKGDGSSWELYQAQKRLIVTDRRFYTSQNLEQQGVPFYSAGTFQEKTGVPFRTGEKVKFNLVSDGRHPLAYRNRRGFEIGKYASITPKGGYDGYLCIGEKIYNRHFQGVFEKGERKRSIREDSLDFVKLEAIIEAYRDEKLNKLYPSSHNGYRDFQRAKQMGVIPVYFSQQSGRLYLSPAALGRKAFFTTLNEKAGEKSHQRCDSRKQLCPACALFGTIEGEKAGSKVRFTDASCCEYQPELLKKGIVFRELGTPRISYFPFYLREGKRDVNYSEGYDSAALEIRGRKYYWHHKPDLYPNVPKNKRNATMDVIDSGAEFRFRIYFENISENQLKQLMAAVNLNENDIDGRYCHKLGHGKPLGYGSAKMIVEQCMIRKFQSDESGIYRWREESYPADTEAAISCDQRTYDSLRIICDFDALNKYPADIVKYPTVCLSEEGLKYEHVVKDNVTANHKWFTDNYQIGKKQPKKVLPEIQSPDPCLNVISASVDPGRDLDRSKMGNQNAQGNRKRQNDRRNDDRRDGYSGKKKR